MTQHLFDKSQEYDAMLAEGLRLSGESKEFFMEGRIRDLRAHLPKNFIPKRILDFGCGIGDTTHYLSREFPKTAIVGVDTAKNAIAHATQKFATDRVSFSTIGDIPQNLTFDLCYTNGVFHHIVPEERSAALKWIHDRLEAGGRFAIFENNPWNPGTRLVMSRVAFDKDAKTISSPELKKILVAAGFSCPYPARFLFYFPRFLSALRPIESFLSTIPFGAQYYWIGLKS